MGCFPANPSKGFQREGGQASKNILEAQHRKQQPQASHTGRFPDNRRRKKAALNIGTSTLRHSVV